MWEYALVFLVLLLIVLTVYLVYERLMTKRRKPESSAYLAALRDLLDGRQESAFTKLRQVVAEEASNLDAYLRLGQILRENNQPDRALQVHRDLTHRPDLTRQDRIAILRQIVCDCLAMDDIKTAEAALREQLALNSSDHWAYTRLLGLQEKAADWAASYDTAVEILKLEGNKSKRPLARYKFEAGRQMYRKREYHKARVLFKEAIGLDPTYVPAYLKIGDSYREEKRLEDAVTFWNKLITAVPDRGHEVIERLQKTFFELGRFGEIQSVCETILEHAPKNLEARRALAEFYEKKGDLDLATELWEEILDDHSDDATIALELIRVYLERGDHKRIGKLLKSLERRRDEQRGRSRETTPASTMPGSSES